MQENGEIVEDLTSKIRCGEKWQECCEIKKCHLKWKGSFIKLSCGQQWCTDLSVGH